MTVVSLFRFSFWAFLSTAVMLVIVSLVDLFFSPHRSLVTVERTAPLEVERRQESMLTVKITNASNQVAYLRWTDDLPESITSTRGERVLLPANDHVQWLQPFVASERGLVSLSHVYLRYRSKLGLWEKQRTYQLKSNMKIIPNMEASRQYLASAQKYLLHEGEKVRKQKTGFGEFSKVRQYAVGDDPRKINWHQSAKLQEMMVNEYEPEHGKHVVIMIDCGRMMGVELERGNRLETHIEAALTVVTAALNNGDYVSVLAFGKSVTTFVPAGKGLVHLQVILKAIYNLSVESNESNYGYAFQYIQAHHRKRSMVILFSDIQQFFLDGQALFFMRQLKKRHLFLITGVENQWLQKNVQLATENAHHGMRKAVAQQQLLQKRQAMIRWQKQGLDIIEAKEEQLAVSAVAYYIDQLNRGTL